MLLGGSSFTSTAQTQPAEIAKRFEIYHEQIPTEKVYIHTSREVLTLGDTLYLSTYVLNGMDHKPTALSGMLHVDLISPEDKIIHSLRLKIDSLGRSHGAFTLSDSLNAGNYTLRGYTNYQLNYDEDYLFSKDIKLLPRLESQNVIEENTDRIPQVNLKFFPEGGELIAGNTISLPLRLWISMDSPLRFQVTSWMRKEIKLPKSQQSTMAWDDLCWWLKRGPGIPASFSMRGKSSLSPCPTCCLRVICYTSIPPKVG